MKSRNSLFQSDEKSSQRQTIIIESLKRKISNSACPNESKLMKIDFVKQSKCLLNKNILFCQRDSNHSFDLQQKNCWEETLIKLGAQVVDKLNENTDYLVWQDGSTEILDQAQKLQIKTVNPKWINDCMKYQRIVSPEKYPIIQAKSINKEEDELIVSIQNLQLWELDPNDEKFNIKEKEQINKRLKDLSEITLIAFHKSVDRSLKQLFENEKKSPYDTYKNFQCLTDEISMFYCDVMVIDNKTLQYDLQFCIACLNGKKIISQEWFQGLVEDLDEHILTYKLPKGLFIGHKINLSYSSQTDKKIIIQLLHLERLIKYVGGEITNEEDCDIFLYLNPSCHNKIKITKQQKIVHAKWFFESIQENQVLNMKKYFLQNV